LPTHKSAAKRIKTAERDRKKNRDAKSTLRGAIKQFRAKKSSEEKTTGLKDITSIIDKSVHKGVIHKNKAARTKSRLARALKSK
jgi:small subunit ribosomal protein S20